jgi:hypothetical protein
MVMETKLPKEINIPAIREEIKYPRGLPLKRFRLATAALQMASYSEANMRTPFLVIKTGPGVNFRPCRENCQYEWFRTDR